MRPSDLLLDFGRPVAYYPGLVKVMGSPHAVIFFSQIFYWQDKAHSELGAHKTREAIESETGLTFDQQATARKQLVSRGILVETHRRLEHKVFYRIDCDKLDKIINENNGISRNGETLFREAEKADFVEAGKPSPRIGVSLRRDSGKPDFDPTETTTEITTEIKNTIGADADAPPPEKPSKLEYPSTFEEVWRAYPKRHGGNSKQAAYKAWNTRVKQGIKPEAILAGVKRYAAFMQAEGKIGTVFVKQASTFFGPDHHFDEAWEVPGPTQNPQQNNTAREAQPWYAESTDDTAEVFIDYSALQRAQRGSYR